MIGDKWLSIRNDKKKGLSYSEIARKYNIDRRTAKKYCESNVKPDHKYSKPRKRKIDAFAPYIDELLGEAPYSAVRIQELVEEHFHTKIGYTTIQEYVKNKLHQDVLNILFSIVVGDHLPCCFCH